jgi:hypothetical protein
VLVVERNFTEFSGEIARDYFGKRHEAGLQVGRYGEAALEGSGAVSSADPEMKTKVSPRLKATVGLMKSKAVEFAIRSSARSPTWRASCRCFRLATYQGEYPR